MMARALLLLPLLGGVVFAAALDVRPDAYLDNARAGAIGAVTGRAFAERARPNAPEQPAADVAVTLLPRSEAFLARLREIRERARNDLTAYRTAARTLVDARRTYERALTEAGAGELVRVTSVDPEGRFEVGKLPAGSWLLLAQQATYVRKGSSKLDQRQRQHFARQPQLTGFYAVTVWVRELTVPAGESTTVELTDRNAWMTAIQEERVLDARP